MNEFSIAQDTSVKTNILSRKQIKWIPNMLETPIQHTLQWKGCVVNPERYELNVPKIVIVPADVYPTVERPTVGHDQKIQPESWIRQPITLAKGKILSPYSTV